MESKQTQVSYSLIYFLILILFFNVENVLSKINNMFKNNVFSYWFASDKYNILDYGL